MSSVSREYIQDYIRANIKPSEGVLRDMEKYALENKIPIIQPEVAQLLKVLIRGFCSAKILEVGTAIGYSAIVMAVAAGENSRVVSVEIDPDMIKRARVYIQKSGLNKNIMVIQGDARLALKELEGRFDFVFIDGAKGHYGEMFDTILEAVVPGGVVVCDNVLFRGMVASDSLVKRRKITIVKRMRKFLEYITQHPQLDTAVVPIGDGISVSCKRGTEDE